MADASRITAAPHPSNEWRFVVDPDQLLAILTELNRILNKKGELSSHRQKVRWIQASGHA
jgi:hypothetical protein